MDRQRDAVLEELLELLQPHFSLGEIKHLSMLWNKASYRLDERVKEMEISSERAS